MCRWFACTQYTSMYWFRVGHRLEICQKIYTTGFWLSPCLSLSLCGSLWLSLALCDSHSGSRWLYLALTVSLPVSLWLSMAPCNSHSGSLWLSQALTGSRWLLLWFPLTLTATLWLTLAVSCSLISLIQSLIGSQDPCSALSAAATLMHFVLVCLLFSSTYVIWCLNSIHC